MKHFLLRYVFEEKEALVESCGFVRCFDQAGDTVVWVEPTIFRGPLAHADREEVSVWLRRNCVAGQIWEGSYWGLGPD